VPPVAVRGRPLAAGGAARVGESYFASQLVGLLRTSLFKIDMAAATAGAALCGLSVHWANAGLGEIFKTLAWGAGGVKATANPLGFLDEIGKVAEDRRMDPLAPLHALLEVESAGHFEDQSLPGIAIDASFIRWICCANELAAIPTSLPSRLHIVRVAAIARHLSCDWPDSSGVTLTATPDSTLQLSVKAASINS
jgi:hypothetical protein